MSFHDKKLETVEKALFCFDEYHLWETYMQVRKQQLELDMEQQTGSK